MGELEKGEQGRIVRAFGGDGLELDTGLSVFLAEIDAPRGDEAYAAQARAELEALALHRQVRLGYGGSRRWIPRPREGEAEAPRETAIAHVFVQSEGGRWFWLQHELVARGAALVRPRRDNHARSADLLAVENIAREAELGLWAKREHRALNPADAAIAALAANVSCLRGEAPYRLVEGRVGEALVLDRRAALTFEGAPADAPFAIAIFGESFSAWDGPAIRSFEGARIRVRGTLGVFREQPQICVDHAAQLEILTTAPGAAR